MRASLAAVGRVLVTAGLLVLAFVGYQLWGTGLYTDRAQADLRSEFTAAQADLDDPVVAPGSTTAPPAGTDPSVGAAGPTAVPGEPVLVRDGDAVAVIRIPRIGVESVVVEGVSRRDLRKGPGHYPGTPLPGQVGNAAIAGHRTTYGAPFFDLADLDPGDEIFVDTFFGTYRYEVRETRVVPPTAVEVVADTPDAWLTLTTCNPKYSARERLVVKAALVPDPATPPIADGAIRVEAPAGTADGDVAAGPQLAEGLQGEDAELGPAVLWGFAAVAVGLVWWWAFRRWRSPWTWLAGALPFLAVLLGCYVFLERALPAGY